MSEYHIPVLLHESVDALVVNKAGVYVDACRISVEHSSYGRAVAFAERCEAQQVAESVAHVELRIKS